MKIMDPFTHALPTLGNYRNSVLRYAKYSWK